MNKVEFTEKFDAIICLDGILPEYEFFRKFKNIPIFCADGAVLKLIDMKIGYEKVIGDLDTLQKKGRIDEIPDSKKVYLPEQETNDFEKTLNYVHKLGSKRILITGFHGGELEHSLNNWSVLMKYQSKLSLCIYENSRYAIPVSKSIILPVEKGEIVGLIPQPKAKLTTKDLKWELQDKILELGKREGARNEALSEKAEIVVKDGSILVFINSRIPFAPNI